MRSQASKRVGHRERLKTTARPQGDPPALALALDRVTVDEMGVDLGAAPCPRRPTRTESSTFAQPVIQQRWMPTTRAQSSDKCRPCPWVSCEYHLALDINPATGSIHLNAGPRGTRTLQRRHRHDVEEWLDRAADSVLDMPETCALDVARRGGATLEEIAELLGIRRERARQI